MVTRAEWLEATREHLVAAKRDLGPAEFLRFVEDIIDRIPGLWAGEFARAWAGDESSQ